MNRQALFCDGTGGYVIPPEPRMNEEILLRFRTLKDDVQEVYLVTDDMKFRMKKQRTTDSFDYYEIHWKVSTKTFEYYFEIYSGEDICFYDQFGSADQVRKEYSFRICPGFSTPDWAKGAVIYQIFVDRFYNGDPDNDVADGEYFYINGLTHRVLEWNAYPESGAKGVRIFYGGDLEGVRKKLDYLEDLGIEAIYFNPLFVSPSNHKYDIQDYDYIDPHFGVIKHSKGQPLSKGVSENRYANLYQSRVTNIENLEASNQMFIELVEEIHARGMKVILDGVFNHCGSFNKWMDRERIYEDQDYYLPGAYIKKDSLYHDFFKFRDLADEAWPYNSSYDGWWGHDTLPKLNYEGSKKLEEYILQIGRKWVSPPFNVDGWRLDVAADLGFSNEYNHVFWQKFRAAVKEANPEALILAEHYGDPHDWLKGQEWDTVMNYDAFMEPLTWFLTGMEKHSDAEREDLFGNADYFVNAMKHHMSRFLMPSLQTAMNELSNHDHSRFLTRTNRMVGRTESRGPEAASEGINKAVMRSAVVIQMTWVGAPTLYYGDEAGLCGFTDPDNRRAYPWGNEDHELIEFHKRMIHIHKKHSVFRTGSLKILAQDFHMLAYSRFEAGTQFIIVIHNSSKASEVKVPVWEAEVSCQGALERVVYSYETGYTLETETYQVIEGMLHLNMGSFSAIILKNIK